MTIKTISADRAAIKAAMHRASMYLVTGEAKFPQQRAFHRHLVAHHFLTAAEQALLAGDIDLAHVAHELFMLVHYDEARTAEPPKVEDAPAPAPEKRKPAPRRKLAGATPGKRERAKLAKAGAVPLGAA